MARHLLHPDGSGWFDQNLDCFFANCVGSHPDWGTTAEEDDPRLDVDDVNGRGPENINVESPEESGRPYRIGVHYFDDDGFGPSRVYLNIYCYGVLEQTIGPVTLARGNQGAYTGNDFWKVADISFADGACTITPLTNGAGGPLIVTSAAAQSAR